MPPPLALFLTLGFIGFLLRRDFRARPNVTGAIWLPIAWLVLLGSRPIAQWLGMFGHHTVSAVEEGNPIDAFVYFSLIIAGFIVLTKRGVNLPQFASYNGWIVFFLCYCLVAVVWSDFPFVAFKRWIKVLGHPIMALIILTEPDWKQALATVMKRSAYVLLPVSILFIKYYPEWGRSFDQYSGQATNTGITMGKNALGCDCIILGFFLLWYLLRVWKEDRSKTRRNELILICGLLLMDGYLLRKAHSATAVVSLLAAVATGAVLGRRIINKRLIGLYVVAAIVLILIGQATFGLIDSVIELTQHESTLSGRQNLWGELLAMDTSPILGVGFESFWLGDRLATVQANHWWHPTQAHNGYLEIYLDLGAVGVFFLLCTLISVFQKVRPKLLTDFDFGRARLSFLVAVILYNWTEATFKGLHPMWFAFYIVALDYPRLSLSERRDAAEVSNVHEERELAYAPR